MSEPSNTAYAFKWTVQDRMAPHVCVPYTDGWQYPIYELKLCYSGYHFCYPNLDKYWLKDYPEDNTWDFAVCEWWPGRGNLWVIEIDADNFLADGQYKGCTRTFRFVENISKSKCKRGIIRAVDRGLSKYGVENFLA